MARQAAEKQLSVSEEEAERIEALLEKAEAFRLEEEPDPIELDRLVGALREAVFGL